MSVRTNGVFFAFAVDAFPWQGFRREEYDFSLPPAQSFSTRKNRSYLLDFQCLMQHIVLWKSSSFLCLLYVLCNTKILPLYQFIFFHFFALCTIFPAPDGRLCMLHYRKKKCWLAILHICKYRYRRIEHHSKSTCQHRPKTSQSYEILKNKKKKKCFMIV